MALTLTSPAFSNGGPIPDKYARQHGNVLPALDWRGAPEGTESYALIIEDPDAPRGTATHLAVCDIPAQQPGLDEGEGLAAFTLAENVYGEAAYGGPQPPPGDGPHHYHFRLLALDVPDLAFTPGDSPTALWRAVEGHVVAEAELVGTYEVAAGSGTVRV